MVRKKRKLKVSNALILLGFIIIALNAFFIVFLEPFLLELQISKAWDLSEEDIQENNQGTFETSELNLELIDSTEINERIDNTKVVAYVSIPTVNLALPILRGASSQNLDVSATTVLENQTLGKGNYPIAGHRTIHPDTLFSPLEEVEKGDKVYLTDKQSIYIYEVINKVIVLPEQIEVLNDPDEGSIVTLITCYGKESEYRRIVIGELVEVIEFTEQLFSEYFTK
jgi:sortase A